MLAHRSFHLYTDKKAENSCPWDKEKFKPELAKYCSEIQSKLLFPLGAKCWQVASMEET